MIESTKTKIHISLPEPSAKQLNDLSKKKGLSRSIIIALAIEEYARKEASCETKK